MAGGSVRLARRALFALPLARCATPPPVPRSALVQGDVPVYVIAMGWHTDVALPAARLTPPLGIMRADFPRAEWLEFGWGQHDVYMTATPSSGEFLRATVPGPSVMLVRPLSQPSPEGLGAPARVVMLQASSAGFAHLCDYIWGFLAKDPAGQPRRIGGGSCGDCLFYASDGTYDLSHTCNTWTAEVLRAGGFPVQSQGVITADAVMGQIS